MAVLFGLLWPFERINGGLLAVGRVVAIVALMIMVIIILVQVVSRYVFDAPLNWTEEAARFGMLWMTALIAPMAYRQGGFVAIDMAERALPRIPSALLTLAILFSALSLLITMSWIGWDRHVDSMTGRGSSASLRLPLDWVGGERIKFQNNWQYASLWICCILLVSVTVELILRQLISLFGGGARLKRLDGTEELPGAA